MWLLTQPINDLFFSQQLVLILGDSHLRGLVDGFVRIPNIEQVSFGFVSFPGIKAAELDVEINALRLPPFIDPQVQYNCFVSFSYFAIQY